MKNPALNLIRCLRQWWALRSQRGLFSWADASLQLNRVFWPARFTYRAAGLGLEREASIKALPEGCYEVNLAHHSLRFYWHAQPDNNLFFLIDQEFNEGNPHCYTTPPVYMQPESLVLDVGACEGLFAFRVLKQGLASRVICFEPSSSMAELTRRGARQNGLSQWITVETLAVGRGPQEVRLQQGSRAEANRIRIGPEGTGERLQMVSLDDYCRERMITLAARDLIKIDAEGADLDVLYGAEQLIKKHAPQIAVTTYHDSSHCTAMLAWLRQTQPAYQFRLKGFSFWTETPRPVLLQAARPL